MILELENELDRLEAELQKEKQSQHRQQSPDKLQDDSNGYCPILAASRQALLSRGAALALAGVFFDRYEANYPIVARHEIHNLVSAVYDYDIGSENATHELIKHETVCHRFLVHIMAAVGLVAQSRDAASIEQAGLLYAEAMADFTTVMQQKGTQTLQCLLFVLLWSLISPATQGLPLLGSPAAPPWHTSGLCMRMCVDLGIHTEAMIQSSTSAGDIMGRALRRRLFWVASKMDQSLGALLGRPPAWHEPRPQEQTVASFQQDETVATQRANSTTANSSTVQKIHADQAMDEALWDSSELYDSFCNTPEGTWNTDESTEILATWDG